VSEKEDTTKWTLDSGASRHFTHDINDFVEYRLIKPWGIKTATSRTTVIAKGTILLKINGNTIRVGPVYHVPELTSKLLSLGEFLNDGLHTRGSSKEIALFTEKNERFLTFYPRTEGDTIFTIQATVSEPESHAYTIYKVDFETMHRRMAHPSNDVFKQAGRYIKDFPKLRIPDEHICPGCAEGKMTNKSFPTSEKRATEPFELIHSDLKSFPVESYRKYKYSIVFYDNYTSHAWTINLRTKDAALPATKQFITMVETSVNVLMHYLLITLI